MPDSHADGHNGLDTACMRDIALSATATTGLFTLLGAVIGAGIGGGLTVTLEILRRRWQRQDVKEDTTKQKRAAELAERRALYPQFLAKGAEFEMFAMNIGLTINPRYLGTSHKDPGVVSPSEAEAAYAKAWPKATEILTEFAHLQFQVDLISGKDVRDLAGDWQRFLLEQLLWATFGKYRTPDEGKKYPNEYLVEAMHAELEDLSLYSIASQLSLVGFECRPSLFVARVNCCKRNAVVAVVLHPHLSIKAEIEMVSRAIQGVANLSCFVVVSRV